MKDWFWEQIFIYWYVFSEHETCEGRECYLSWSPDVILLFTVKYWEMVLKWVSGPENYNIDVPVDFLFMTF